jgi:Uma2 family endonuclease
MSQAQQVRRYTPEEYYRLEVQANHRSEYYDGEIFAMAGSNARHCRINGNILCHLGNRLDAMPCVPYGCNLKLRVKATGLRTYPDVSVYCGKPELDPDDPARQTYVNPTVLAEVLSPSSEEFDRSTKSVHYRRIESLKIVLLVSQDEARAEMLV